MSMDFIKAVDRYVGFVICLLLRVFKGGSGREGNTRPEKAKKILALKFWGIGSVLLIAPALRKIKEKYPGSEVHFLTLASNTPICRMIDTVDRTITLKLSGNIFTLGLNVIRMLGTLRAERYDLLIDFEFFTRFSAIVSFLSGSKCKIGFHTWDISRGSLHDIEVPFNYYWHCTKTFINLAVGAMAIKEEDLELPKLNVPEPSRRYIENELREMRITNTDKLIVVNVNSGELALERRWMGENFVQLIERLVSEYVAKIVLVGSEKEKPYVDSILGSIHNHNNKVYSLAGRADLYQLTALFKRADLVITNDSGPLHIACAVDVPTVSFFGPETPALYGPRGGDKHMVFFKDLSCSPCLNVHNAKTVKCRHLKAECLAAISVDEVFRAIEEKFLAHAALKQ